MDAIERRMRMKMKMKMKMMRIRMRGAVIAGVTRMTRWMIIMGVIVVAAAACQPSESALEVRTFELGYLDPSEAAEMIEPYVYHDREKNPGRIGLGPGSITVRERPDNLSRIAEVLERFDKPEPGVTLHFRLIEADGAAAGDPAIADVESELRKVFQYDGYRLIGEGVLRGQEGQVLTQLIATERGDYRLQVRLERVRPQAEGGTIQMGVELNSEYGFSLGTGLSLAVGPDQTSIIGSARPTPERGAVILTVEAEFDGGKN